jgi:F0F1-type ATP synthase epsilon subunit
MILLSTIQDNILRNIPRDTSKNNWNALTTKYKSNNVQNIVSLRRRLMNSKHGNNETIYVAIVILQGLSQEYDNFVQVLTLNAKTLKVDDIEISLIQEEHRRSEKKQESKNSEGDVFYSKEKKYKRRRNGK